MLQSKYKIHNTKHTLIMFILYYHKPENQHPTLQSSFNQF